MKLSIAHISSVDGFPLKRCQHENTEVICLFLSVLVYLSLLVFVSSCVLVIFVSSLFFSLPTSTLAFLSDLFFTSLVTEIYLLVIYSSPTEPAVQTQALISKGMKTRWNPGREMEISKGEEKVKTEKEIQTRRSSLAENRQMSCDERRREK
jgi:hypothetical protein